MSHLFRSDARLFELRTFGLGGSSNSDGLRGRLQPNPQRVPFAIKPSESFEASGKYKTPVHGTHQTTAMTHQSLDLLPETTFVSIEETTIFSSSGF